VNGEKNAGDNQGPEEVRARFTESAYAAERGKGSDTYRKLRDMLAAAVPLWILRYQRRGGPTPADFKRVAGYSDELGRADVLLFGGKHRPGEIAAFFNHMAEAMAVLSFCPRGIELFDLHYESLPLPDDRQEREGEPQPGSSQEPGGAS
jgi:hypothetical protein